MLAHGLLRRLHDDDSARRQVAQITQLRRELASQQRRSYSGMVGMMLLLSAFILAALDGYAPTMVAGAPLVSWLLGAVGGVLVVLSWPGR
jgi:ubiquinone biosynthesis protein